MAKKRQRHIEWKSKKNTTSKPQQFLRIKRKSFWTFTAPLHVYIVHCILLHKTHWNETKAGNANGSYIWQTIIADSMWINSKFAFELFLHYCEFRTRQPQHISTVYGKLISQWVVQLEKKTWKCSHLNRNGLFLTQMDDSILCSSIRWPGAINFGRENNCYWPWFLKWRDIWIFVFWRWASSLSMQCYSVSPTEKSVLGEVAPQSRNSVCLACAAIVAWSKYSWEENKIWNYFRKLFDSP